MTKYRKPEDDKPMDLHQLEALPVDRSIAIYYRQSSDAQVGNVGTTLQTVDMIRHLQYLGWDADKIIMIDSDAGVSGMKKISERPGMTELMRLIETQEVSAVAAQDVDRFFRDVTQIQTNIFIEACRENNVRVVTPRENYHFSHPHYGLSHRKMFRLEADRAAEYIEYQIKGRLVKSRTYLSKNGYSASNRVTTGYMVDNRPKLPNGEFNPNYRKYVPFEIYAGVIQQYFTLFHRYNGRINPTYDHIQQYGPFLPEFEPQMLPEGFRYHQSVTHRSESTGKLCPSKTGLRSYFTNVMYIGHWVHKRAIVQWDNHEPLIDRGLFMFAFNALSKTDFYGEPNENYAPYRSYKPSQPRSDRDEPYPTYAGFLYSDDIENLPHRRLGAFWNRSANSYQYFLYRPSDSSNEWSIKSQFVDNAVEDMLLERLRLTTIDEATWATALQSTRRGNDEEARHIEQEIKRDELAQDHIIASLRQLTNAKMIQRLQANYEALERHMTDLRRRLREIKQIEDRELALMKARPALQKIVENWNRISSDERVSIFQEFIDFVRVSCASHTIGDRYSKRVHVYWRDGLVSERLIRGKTKGQHWSKKELDLLKQLIEGQAPQHKIMQVFPIRKWKHIRETFMYHFGEGRDFREVYKVFDSKKQTFRRYKSRQTWYDTEEYQASLKSSKGSSVQTKLPENVSFLGIIES
jgi:hypothetical protein